MGAEQSQQSATNSFRIKVRNESEIDPELQKKLEGQIDDLFGKMAKAECSKNRHFEQRQDCEEKHLEMYRAGYQLVETFAAAIITDQKQ